MPPRHTNPFHLLEITLISAQDLAASAKNMKTYAVAWINPDRKLTTKIDNEGHTNPNWNDKFIFRIDNAFLECETSAVMIEIYAIGWMKDFKIGTVRFLINNLEYLGSEIRFVALQIRRPSGRPQGILNVGATLLDSTMRSMPLCSELGSSAVGSSNPTDDNKSDLKSESLLSPKPVLQRSKSERSSSTVSDGLGSIRPNRPTNKPKPNNNNNGSYCNGGSTITGSEVGAPKGSIISDVGPSPSVVAAAIARGIYPLGMKVVDTKGSSILQEWKEKEETEEEGLKTKIAKWKTDLPPVFDHAGTNNGYRKATRRQHRRRHTDGGATGNGGLFSCIGSAYGCEFKIVCGSNGDKAEKKKKARRRSGGGSGGGRVHASLASDSELS